MRLSYDGANATYNSLQTTLTGTVKRDLHLQVSYTLAKAMDATTASGSGGDLQNVTNPYQGWRYDFGPSVFDRRNVFFANFVYDLPIFRNATNRALRGAWADGRSPASLPRTRVRPSISGIAANRACPAAIPLPA